MSNEMDKEFYIFGEPVDTELGQVRFLTYKEYLMNIQDLSMISMNVLHIYHQYRKMFDEKDKKSMEAVETLKDETLYNIIMQTDNFRSAYLKMFSLVLRENDVNNTWSKLLIESLEEDNNSIELKEKEELKEPLMKALELIFSNEELFMHYRGLVMDMQMLSEAEVNENPIIQSFLEKGRDAKQALAEKQTFSDIVSSVVVGSGIGYKEIVDMTVLQIYSTYYRIGASYSYSTTTLFATVSDKVSIESWNKHIDLFQSEKSGMSKDQFNSQFGGLF